MKAWVKIAESVKPKGLDYICVEGHTTHVGQADLIDYVGPATCLECDKEQAKVKAALNG